MNAQDLKNSILQLAIQGKLVEQREEEGTAKELLEKIEAEKKQLIKEGKIKKQKDLPAIKEDDIPFDIPDSWEWVRLGTIHNIINGFTPSKNNAKFWNGGTIPWFTIADVRSQGRFINYTKQSITEQAISKNSDRIIPKDSILICCTASVGEYAYTNISLTTNQQFNGLVIKDEYKRLAHPMYIYEFAKTLKQNLILQAGKTTINFVSVKKVSNIVVPIPPLEEQKRIVAKIEELMPYVDKYDVAYSEVEELNKKFPEDMQKSILQYAIQGKLVEQREEEGTAEELYKQIQEEKKNLVKEGKIKNSKALTEITEDEIPFDIPESWKWVRIKDIIYDDLGGGTPSKQNASYWNGKIPWMSVKDYVNNPNGLEDTLEKITEEGLKKSSSNLIKAGNIIVCTRIGLGKIAINNVDMAINQDLRALFLLEYIDKNYFIYNYSRINIVGKGTTVKGIKRAELLNYLFPLPPMAEQKRIVTKIEELMSYTKQLLK